MRQALIVFVIACGGTDDGPRQKTFGGDRPVDLKTPATLVDGKQYPLLVILHGFGASGFVQTAVFGMGSVAETEQVLVLAPEGTTNSTGKQFWNADPYCCDFQGQMPDDVAYLGGLIEEVSAEWPVDQNAVFLLGHSNGGYMSYRMACDRPDLIAAIAPLAGNAASTTCEPSRPVNVVHMHGTADATVPYSGAETSLTKWASYNGCGTTRTPTTDLDLDSAVTGVETMGSTTVGCPANGAVELWRMEGSTHVPLFQATFASTIMEWFTAHSR